MTIVDARPNCFYHPIRVVFLDDNREFLETINLEFSDTINLLIHTSKDTTYQFIKSQPQDIKFNFFKFENSINRDTIYPYEFNFEATEMLNLLYNKNRFDKISVLVMDYEIFKATGIEFDNLLIEKNIFKIMLADKLDSDIVIKAFNKGQIDKFIFKTNENLYSELIQAVRDLTHRHFKELSLNSINGHNPIIKDLFNNKLYQELFADVAKQAKAIEHYLIDHSGSILFLDKDANPTWFIIKHVDELQEQYNLLLGYDLQEEFMNSFAKKEKLLFLLTEKDYRKPVHEWLKYSFNSNKLDNNYYYSIIQEPITDIIDWSRVVSYSAYTASTKKYDL